MKVFAVVVGFCAGIALASLSAFSWWGGIFLLFLATCFLLLFMVRRGKIFLLSTLFLLGAFFGALRVEVSHNELPHYFAHKLNTPVTFVGKVVAEPDVRETSVRLTLRVEEEGAVTNILVVAPLYPEVRHGETVRVSGTLSKPEPFDTETGRVFHYETFLAKDGVFALIERASLEIVSPRGGGVDQVFGFFSDLKFAGISALSTALPEPHASLASGLLLGGKQGLGKELLDDFILAGLVHIVVLSGYNVMIVAEAVLRTFSLLTKRYAVLIAGAVIFGFVLVAGAGSASVRAGIMAGIALFGRATGRTYDAFRALMVAGVLMLLWNPLLLMYDPGFQLSCIATLGLIFGTPIVERWMAFVRIGFLREIISATISAQIVVLPLVLYQNGLFSLVALPANVAVLPLVPLAMALSAFAGGAGAFLPSVAPLIALPAYGVLSIIIGLTEFFASLPFAGITVPAFPLALVLISYGALVIFVRKNYVTHSK